MMESAYSAAVRRAYMYRLTHTTRYLAELFEVTNMYENHLLRRECALIGLMRIMKHIIPVILLIATHFKVMTWYD